MWGWKLRVITHCVCCMMQSAYICLSILYISVVCLCDIYYICESYWLVVPLVRRKRALNV